MIQIPTLGTTEQTKTSRYQITLVDESNKTLQPMEYRRIHRYFKQEKDRNEFVALFEHAIAQENGKIVYNAKTSHPVFSSFDIYDAKGNKEYSLTVYH